MVDILGRSFRRFPDFLDLRDIPLLHLARCCNPRRCQAVPLAHVRVSIRRFLRIAQVAQSCQDLAAM